ncbi:MAG TPA: RlmE family RNA methyltransferase [Stellaceae bacterium]
MRKQGGGGSRRPPGSGRREGEDTTTVPTASRPKAVRVHTARRRSHSSTQWLQRQLNDPYVAEAKRRGYRSRAAFKLLQLDEKFGLLKPGLRVVDLGCAPGGWLQVAAERIGAAAGKGRLVGIDFLPTDAVPGAEILQLDFLAPDAPERLHAALAGPADLVLSDMAAPTTGHAATDHLRIVALVEAAYEFAAEVLAPGGGFVAKVFQGGTEGTLLAALKRDFASVRHAKPAASRTESAETYVVATGFRGRNAAAG